MVGHIAMAEEEEGGKYEAVGVDRPFGGGNSWVGILRVGERCITGESTTILTNFAPLSKSCFPWWKEKQ